MSEWQQPGDPTMRHLFAVMRLDFHDDDQIIIPCDDSAWGGGGATGPSPAQIAGTRAYWSPEEAVAEARRLNAINADKGARYFITLLRVAAPPTQA